MNYSNALLTTIRSLLKASNQRIVQLDKDFGYNSPITKEATAFLQKGSLNKYLTQSNPGGIRTKTPTSIKSSVPSTSHMKIDISRVMKDIKNGNIKESELNALLIQASGKKIVNGETQNAGPGIPTTTKLKKELSKDYDIRNMSKKDIINELNARTETMTNFQTEYELAKLTQTPAQMQSRFPGLYKSGKKTYLELDDLAEAMRLFRSEGEKAIDQGRKQGQINNGILKNGE